MKHFVTHGYQETVALGERFGRTLRGGAVVALFGGMGMGKTAFVTGIAKGMGLDCAVSSPTYSIVNVYGDEEQLCHFDMYRVSTWTDLESTGFFDYLQKNAVICVEWSENIENALPENAIYVQFSKGKRDNIREISFEKSEAVF